MLPSALEHVQEIAGAGDRNLAIFLDYDGTLTPIVRHPEKAFLSGSTRQTLRTLAMQAPVAIDWIVYAGSHGFDIAGTRRLRRQEAIAFLPALDAAEKELRENLAGIAG